MRSSPYGVYFPVFSSEMGEMDGLEYDERDRETG